MFNNEAELLIEGYVSKIEKLNIVQSIVLGCDDKRGYLFNIFAGEVSIDDFTDPRYSPQLTSLGGKLSRDFSKMGLSLRVSYVQPSHLELLKDRSRLRGINLLGGITMEGKGFEL